MLHKWIIKELSKEEEACKQALEKELGLEPALCTLLVQRGIKTKEEALAFFSPSLDTLCDPFLLNDMDKAVERLTIAMNKKEKILIYGDYDVDGTTAVALMYRFLLKQGANIGFYIPDRYEEGYGVSYKGIDYAYDNGYTLMIVLDCGIKAIEKVQYAKEKPTPVDIIICDHHTPDNALPEAVAVLDPKREDSTYPYKHLSGCGVGFKLAQAFAIKNHINPEEYLSLLDLLAVSIASDIVPITGENRVLMYHGLQLINQNPCIGLKAIIDVCGLQGKEITTSDIVFKIGPRINASGRMDSGKEAVLLLISNDLYFAKEKSLSIDMHNQERKNFDQVATQEAKDYIDSHAEFGEKHAIVVYNQEWHKGVIGIVASRISEQYHKPAIVLTLSNGMATGSARSVNGFDLYKAIESCRDLLLNFGGHMYAAGLTLKLEHIEEFSQRFNAYVEQNISKEAQLPQIDIDTTLTLSEITPRFFAQLQAFAPFGPENMKPVFATLNAINRGGCKVVGKEGDHLKLEITDASRGYINGIAFGRGKEDGERVCKRNQHFDVCYTLEENNFNGQKSIQIMAKDIR